ncbi:hypothetical protein HK102_001004 [Quaeritorhiza haematococci]|nr:hypothetical protein HK102_001004 [Quaeritorhiza haematococci]
MEVEIKIRLPTPEAHIAVLEVFSSLSETSPTANADHLAVHLGTHLQENYFFDTDPSDDGIKKGIDRPESSKQVSILESRRIVFRLRRTRVVPRGGTNEESEVKWNATLKGNAVLADGVSRVEEMESLVSADIAERIVRDPTALWELARKTRDIVLLEVTNRITSIHNSTTPPASSYPSETSSPPIRMKQTGTFRTRRDKFRWQGLIVEVDETEYDFGKAYEIEVESEDPERAKSHL